MAYNRWPHVSLEIQAVLPARVLGVIDRQMYRLFARNHIITPADLCGLDDDDLIHIHQMGVTYVAMIREHFPYRTGLKPLPLPKVNLSEFTGCY